MSTGSILIKLLKKSPHRGTILGKLSGETKTRRRSVSLLACPFLVTDKSEKISRQKMYVFSSKSRMPMTKKRKKSGKRWRIGRRLEMLCCQYCVQFEGCGRDFNQWGITASNSKNYPRRPSKTPRKPPCQIQIHQTGS